MTSIADVKRARLHQGLTSAELISVTGLTYRQVDHWTRQGLLRPNPGSGVGSGNPRTYPDLEVEKAQAMAALRDAGFDLVHIAEHIDHLIQHGGFQAGPVTITYTPEHS